MSKVLVCGSEGSLMQATIPELLARGYEVTGVDNFARYGRIERERDYRFVEEDLSNQAAVDALVDGHDLVIQAAATIYGVAGFHKKPASILSNDLRLHANILDSVRRHAVGRVVYISSSMVYERCGVRPVVEDDPDLDRIPLTDYGLSKRVGERMCQAYADEFGTDFVVWRPFNIISPLEDSEGDPGISHVFADFIDAIIDRKVTRLPIIGDGEQVRCFTWIGDVASGIAQWSAAPETSRQAFNLGNPQPMTMRQLAELIARVGRDLGLLPADYEFELEHLPAPATDVRYRVPDVSKARERLGWTPTVAVEEAIRRCVEHRAMAKGSH